MTKIVIFIFGKAIAGQISTRTIKGQHWYAARDLCNHLGIVNHSQAVHRKREKDELTLKDSEKTHFTFYNGRKKKEMLMVNNGGMLKLIFQGTSTLALEFQRRADMVPQHLIPDEWADYITD